MEITLERCTIRTLRAGDAPGLARMANDRSIWRNLRDRFPHPYALHHAEFFIEHARVPKQEHAFAICVGDEVAGVVSVVLGEDIYRRTAEIGYWLGAEWRGKGIASEAVRAIAQWALATFDLVRLHAAVFVWNPASARVLEKAGFTLECVARKAAFKDGEVVDELVYVLVP